MNRSELAALLTANPPVPASSSPLMFRDDMRSPITSSPNSPRLAFQSRVRQLNQQPSPPRSELRTHRRRHSQLEHVSSLRVTHKRSHSAQPAPQQTPNFWAEEWEAWGQRSPKSPQSRLTPTKTNVVVSSPRPKIRPQSQSREQAPLPAFTQLQSITDADNRTPRGPLSLAMLEEEDEDGKDGQMENNGEDGETPGLSTSANQTGRTSKFIEGSMNERSIGIASSWFQEGFSDSDKPLPFTPAIKHVTFSCTPGHERGDDDQVRELPTIKRHSRRGLRKSISNFNFQALSEKMKIFGGPSHDPAIEVEEKRKKVFQKLDGMGIDILNDRKRKADQAYAAQFGFKKQKFPAQSSGGAAPSSDVGGAGHQEHNRNEEQRSHNSGTSRRSAATKSPSLPRKKSRRELEQEIADLRARLDAQHDLHHRRQLAAATSTHENAVRGKLVMLAPGKGRAKLDEDVPPMPPLPERGVLQVLENSRGADLRQQKGECLRFVEEEEKQGKRSADGGQSWEWPEDVF